MAADTIGQHRKAATTLIDVKPCGFDLVRFSDAARAIRPADRVATSESTDGSWQLHDGMLAFTKDLPKGREQEVAMALALCVGP